MAEANSKLFIQKRKEETNMTEKAARILFPEKVAYYEAEIAKRDAAIIFVILIFLSSNPCYC